METKDIITLVGIIFTILLGAYNLWLNLKGQTKSHREFIFHKQFDFFVQFQSLVSDLEDDIMDINSIYADNNLLKAKIHKLVNEIEALFSKNEFIIPDELYSTLYDNVIYYYVLTQSILKEVEKVDDNQKKELIQKNFYMMDKVREYIGIEQLSEENKQLINRKFKI